MNRQQIMQLSMDLLLRYYENNVSMFLSYVDDNVLWYGPADGQVLRGRAAMLTAWAAEQDQPLTFSVGDLKAETVSPASSLCAVVLRYSVTTHYPSGHDISLNQRLALTWYERKITDAQGKRVSLPRIMLCDVTNPHPKSPEDTIYPVHFEQVYSGFITPPRAGERLRFHGYGNTEYYLFSNSILWGDSCGNGQRCLLHLTDGTTAEIAMSVRSVVEAHPTLFLRCHSSHFVNPTYVKGLRRFAVTMITGAELPIPEKSYTAFKKALNEYM